MNINELTALKIKEIRKGANISAEAVAANLAISKTAYSQLENGKVEITLSRLEAIAKIFNMPLYSLIHQSNGSQTIQITNGENSQNIQTQNNNDPQLVKSLQSSIDALQLSMELLKRKSE